MLDYKEIITYIFAIGVAQAIFLFFILWRKRENKFANKFLAFTMLIFAIDLIAGVIFLTDYIKIIPWIMGVNNTLPFLYGPLIYLYVVFLIHEREAFRKIDFIHFVPFLLAQIYGIFFFYFEDSSYQLSMADFSTPNPWHIELLGQLIPVSGIIYVALTVIITLKFNREIKNSLANIEKIDLSWLIYLVLGTAIVWLVVILSYLIGFIYGDEIQANLLIYVTISIFLYTLAIKSFKQPEFEINFKRAKENKIYKKSGLSHVKADEILNKAQSIMETEKLFLDTKLNLNQLSRNLKVSSHNLSEVINTKLQQNFYDFVNSYRIDEVKRLIKEDINEVYSILAHGFEAGFTSKSAFYSAFKKFTGKTPAQYRGEIL